MGAPQPKRDILLFHRGRMGERDHPTYSRGVRQRVRGSCALFSHNVTLHPSLLSNGKDCTF
jgi:hypothetical protein